MNESIFLVDNNGQLVEMNESTYLSEDLLQKLLEDYPALISGSQIHPDRPRRWILISREFGVPDDKDASQRWSLDHLFFDQDAIPTLVEVKRSTDTRIRREVVGQILDYAANAVSYWTIEEFKHRFEEACNDKLQDPNTILGEFLDEEMDASTFWENAKTNLKAGKIRLLIIADTIPKELQRIIEFLNEQMNPAEILGVEIKQFIGQNLKTLVPRVIGQTSNAQSVKGRSQAREENWTEETFFAELEKVRGAAEAAIARIILDWISKKVNTIWYGTGRKGSLVPINKVKGKRDAYRFCFAIWTDGSIEIYFQHMKGRPPFDDQNKRLDLLERLNKIKGVNIPKDKVSARPTFPLGLLANNEEMEKFMNAFNWYYAEQ